MFWVRYHLRHLKAWREAVKAVANAVKSLGLDADVYVIGGAAERRLTVLSDIDVLVCVDESCGVDLWELRRRILTRAMDEHGLPWDYPIELHILVRRECEKLLKSLKAIPVKA